MNTWKWFTHCYSNYITPYFFSNGRVQRMFGNNRTTIQMKQVLSLYYHQFFMRNSLSSPSSQPPFTALHEADVNICNEILMNKTTVKICKHFILVPSQTWAPRSLWKSNQSQSPASYCPKFLQDMRSNRRQLAAWKYPCREALLLPCGIFSTDSVFLSLLSHLMV